LARKPVAHYNVWEACVKILHAWIPRVLTPLLTPLSVQYVETAGNC
jgi:hypothetical protein